MEVQYLVSQLQPDVFERELLKRPSVLIVSPEFLASTQVLLKCLQSSNKIQNPISKVRDILLNCGLAPNGKRPVVAIDECQVHVNVSVAAKLLIILGVGFRLWLDRFQVQLWKFYLDMVDSSFGSQVGN